MTIRHPEAGRLQALIDGELSLDSASGVERHLLRCPECRERMVKLQEAESRVGGSLGLLNPETDLEAARWEARRRWAVRRSVKHRKRLAAAAVVILFLGASAAAAMPGSPVRAWLGGDTPALEVPVDTEAWEAALAIDLVAGRGRVELDRGVRLELPGVPHGVEVLVGGVLRLEVRDGVVYQGGLEGEALSESEWLAVDLDDGDPDGQ